MKQQLKWIVAVIGGVAVIAAALYFGLRGSDNNDNAPNGTYWTCSNPAAKHEFRMSIAQVSDWHRTHYGQPIACPTCGKPAVRASKCSNCGAVTPWTVANSTCPKCKKPYPPEE